MYKDIKSCIFTNGQMSNFFPCERGVRQGENLSPLLFSIFLNDLQSNMFTSGCQGVKLQHGDPAQWLNLLILLYADDTLILSYNPTDFQKSLDAFADYCETWHLKVNLSKSNVIIFGARNTNMYHFTLHGSELEITNKYKYLGIYFTSNGSFATARKFLTEQANKAMHLLYTRIYNLDLPIDLQLKLFDHTIVPILLYGSEIWGFESLDIIEQVHNTFLRKITKARKSTPIYMLHGELGRYPLSILIKCRMLTFWNRLVSGKNTKYAYKIYEYMILQGPNHFKWTRCITNILQEIGRPDIWLNQNIATPVFIKQLAKRTLVDQYIQCWTAKMTLSSKGMFYQSFKSDLQLEKYFTILPKTLSLYMFKLRTSNH